MERGAPTLVGAVTFANGTTGITGNITSTTSLMGSTAVDRIGIGGVVALRNGNYVVVNNEWNNGGATDAGSITWGSGSTGITGTVSNANSLVGTTSNDTVGSGGVIALTNGNFLVSSPNWDLASADIGASTWGSGTSGITGDVSQTNSLIGSTASDMVSSNGILALTNGNYVVHSGNWDNGGAANAGAVTWGDGTTGITGTVSTTNSLVGVTASDQIGSNNVLNVTGDQFVVTASTFEGVAANSGAVTFVNSNNGTFCTGGFGPVSSSNSFLGVNVGPSLENIETTDIGIEIVAVTFTSFSGETRVFNLLASSPSSPTPSTSVPSSLLTLALFDLASAKAEFYGFLDQRIFLLNSPQEPQENFSLKNDSLVEDE